MITENYQDIVNNVNKLLDENTEWKIRYANYAEKLLEHKNNFNAQALRQLKFLTSKISFSLTYHSTITSILNNEIFLMYHGLKVIKVKVDSKGRVWIHLLKKDNLTESKIKYQLMNDNYEKIISEARYFIKKLISDNKNLEYAVESSLKEKIRKQNNKDVFFKEFAPIAVLELENSAVFHFQMPVPISASKIYKSASALSYSKNSKPGIDLMARSKKFIKKKDETSICIIEIKDSFVEKERPELAIKQAIAYSTFIGRLLRTNEARNDIWYSFFRGKIQNFASKGYMQKLFKPLEIRTFIAMPLENNKTSLSFGGVKLSFNEEYPEDQIVLGYMDLVLDDNHNVISLKHSE
ncbi:MAG: hypothetical protein GX638_00865 [Crenarchaeota archaeon]|jgi:hypothetical protein|nr:hypothetical protein [Thermoproteota archaeon]